MRAVDREAEWLKAMQRVGEFLSLCDNAGGIKGPGDATLTGFTARLPTEEKPETLLVLKASGGEGRFVSFVGGLTLTQALLTWRAKVMGGKVRWREDVPYGER